MGDTFLRLITLMMKETRCMIWCKEEDSESGYRARIILLKDEGYTVPEIRVATNNRHDISTREWIHRFNEKGIDGIASKIRRHRPIRVTAEIEKQVVDTATKNPRECYGLPFSTWSLRTLAGYTYPRRLTLWIR